MKRNGNRGLAALLALGLVITSFPDTARGSVAEEPTIQAQTVSSVKDGYITTSLDHGAPAVEETDFTDRNGASYKDVSYGRDLTILTDKYPQTRAQGTYGTSWAFSSIALMEFDLVTNHSYSASVDLSELQNAYFTYHSVEDPLGGTDDDEVNYYNSTVNYLDRGGNIQFSAYSLLNWLGSTKEEDVPYEDAVETLSAKINDKWAYAGKAHLQNMYRLDLKKNPNTVKKCILKYGAAGVSYYASTSSDMLKTVENPNCNPTKVDTYYCNKDTSTNHSAVIVGWDDDFSKEYFATEPEGDGAWLVRNSMSEGNESSVYGYFWISYYDKSLNPTAYVFDVGSTGSSAYDHNYQYDGTFWTGSIGSKKGANIFTVPSDITANSEDLKAVGVSSLYQSGVECTVQIYTDLANPNNPTSGILRNTTTKKLTYAGFHTIKLSEAVNLAPGETYAVVVTYSKGGIEIECKLDYAGSVKFLPDIDPGESFYYTGSAWKDIAEISDAKKGFVGNLRIKAYTCDSQVVPSNDYVLTNVKQKTGTATSVTLSWDKNTKAGGYEIYRSTAKEGKYTLQEKITSKSTTTFKQTGLKKGKAYYYKVRSYKTVSGTKHYGPFVLVKAYTSPSTPEDVKSTAQTKDSVTISWSKSTGATGYAVYSRTSTKDSWKRIAWITDAKTLTYKHTGLESGKTYYYSVKAYRKTDNYIYSSRSNSVTVSTKLNPVEEVKQTKATKTSITLTWKALNTATSYQVWCKTEEKGKYSKVYEGTKTTFTDTKRTAGTKYYYKVRGLRVVDGKKVYGSYTYLNGVTSPAKVTGLKTSSKTDTTIKLSWDKVNGASGYVVYYKSSSKGKKVHLKTIKDGTVNSCSLTNLTPLKNYYFIVKAYTDSGSYKSYGVLSDVVSVKMLPQRPASFVQADATDAKIKLSWNTVSDADGYEIYGCKTEKGTYSKLKTVTDAKTNSYTNTGLDSGRTYFYKIRSYVTVDGKKTYSPYVKLKANTTVGSVSGLAVSDIGSNSATFTWKSVENAQYYDVYIKAEGETEYTCKLTVAQTEVKTATTDSLLPGTSYEVYVVAYRTNGTYKAYGKESEKIAFSTQSS